MFFSQFVHLFVLSVFPISRISQKLWMHFNPSLWEGESWPNEEILVVIWSPPNEEILVVI